MFIVLNVRKSPINRGRQTAAYAFKFDKQK